MPDMRVLAYQSEWWVTRENKRIRIEDLHPNHAHNAAEMLARNARERKTHWAEILMFAEEMAKAARWEGWLDEASDGAYDGIMSEYREWRESRPTSVEVWLETLPLMKALRRQAANPGISVRVGEEPYMTDFTSWQDWRDSVLSLHENEPDKRMYPTCPPSLKTLLERSIDASLDKLQDHWTEHEDMWSWTEAEKNAEYAAIMKEEQERIDRERIMQEAEDAVAFGPGRDEYGRYDD